MFKIICLNSKYHLVKVDKPEIDGLVEVFDTVETFYTYDEIKDYMVEMDILKKDMFNKIGGK